jgi:hypothetical protein
VWALSENAAKNEEALWWSVKASATELKSSVVTVIQVWKIAWQLEVLERYDRWQKSWEKGNNRSQKWVPLKILHGIGPDSKQSTNFHSDFWSRSNKMAHFVDNEVKTAGRALLSMPPRTKVHLYCFSPSSQSSTVVNQAIKFQQYDEGRQGSF